MPKFKVGQKVRVKHCPDDFSLIGKAFVITDVGTGDCRLDVSGVTKYSTSGMWNVEKKWLEPLEKTWETLEPLDVLVRESGGEETVLSVVGDFVVRTSRSSSVKYKFGTIVYQTISSLKEDGWEIKQSAAPEETIEIAGRKYSKKEVEEKLKNLKEIK